MKKLLRFLSTVLALMLLTGALSSCIRFSPVQFVENLIREFGSGNETESETELPDESESESEETVTETEREYTEADYTKYEGIKFVLPDGFFTNEANDVLFAYPSDYPFHSDYMAVSAGNTLKYMYTESNLRKYYEEEEDLDIIDLSVKDIKVDGYDCALVHMSFNYGGYTIHEVQYNIFLRNKSVIVAFNNLSGDYVEAFERCASSIKIGK